MKKKKNSPPTSKNLSQSLEEILNQKITLDTDIMDFFLIAGWGVNYFAMSQIYSRANAEMKNRLWDYTYERKKTMAQNTKIVESKFYKFCADVYKYEGIKTLRD